MENNNMLPSAARSDAASPMPEETANRLKIESPEPASAGATSFSEVPGSTELNASDNRSAGLVPNDAQLQLVLRNAHPLQDTSLSLAQRVDAFKQFEKEVRDTQAYWKDKGGRPTCKECGKQHAPPHTTKEQQALAAAAFKEGKRLRKELNVQLNNMPRSRPRDVMKAGCDSVAPSAPPTKKPKSVFCENCSKWHPGGEQECRAPLCPLGCGKHHMPEEGCDAAAKRFARVATQRNPSAPAPSVVTATDSARMDALSTLLRGLPDDLETLNSVSAFVGTLIKGKRADAGPAENAGSSKRQKKKTGRGNSCQARPQDPHGKDPPKPDDRGQGNATQA